MFFVLVHVSGIVSCSASPYGVEEQWVQGHLSGRCPQSTRRMTLSHGTASDRNEILHSPALKGHKTRSGFH